MYRLVDRERLTFISATPSLALSCTEDLLVDAASLGPAALTPGLAGATLALGLTPVTLLVVVVVTEGRAPGLGTAGLAPDVAVPGARLEVGVGRVALVEAGAGAKLALALDAVIGKVPGAILGLLAPELSVPLAAVPLTLCADPAAFVCPAGRVEVGLKGSFNLPPLAVAVAVVLLGFGGGASDTLARAGAAAVPVARSRVGALATFGEGGTVRGAVPGRAAVGPREVEAERARVGALTPGV